MPELEIIKQKIAPIAEKYQLTSIWIFGSYANGTQTEGSDVDFLLKTEDVLDGFKIVEVKFSLSDALGKKVDVITTGSIRGSLLEGENLGEVLIYNKEQNVK